KNHFYLATECGAENLAVISGPFSEKTNINESMESFYESLCEICEKALEHDMKILVEPLDRYAHKRKFIGPSKDLLLLMKKVKKRYKNIGVAFDTAHSALNDENIEESISLLSPYIEQIHLSNAVLDSDDPMYGDNHMELGFPGFLHEESIFKFIDAAEELDLFKNGKIRLSMEVRTPSTANSDV